MDELTKSLVTWRSKLRSIVRVVLTALLAMAIIGCSSSDDNYNGDYIGSWISETPQEASISFETTQGLVTVNGEVTLYLDLFDDGMLNLDLEFTSTEWPCDSAEPCSISGRSPYDFAYHFLRQGISPEGLEADYIRITNETTTDLFEGYVYTGDGRLCMSHSLWESFSPGQSDAPSNPESIDFSNCFIAQTDDS